MKPAKQYKPKNETMKKSTATKKCRRPATIGLAVGLFLCLSLPCWAQTSTVVIAEVMYDHPLYDNETVSVGHTGEFMSLYNYGEENVDIGGWRVVIAGLAGSRGQTAYTIPSNTVLPGMSLAVIASCPARSTFDIGNFYGMDDSAASGNIVLYTATLAYPDTRSRIRVYNARNEVEDEVVYDGMSAALAGEPLLRAENAVNPKRPMSSTVSIQRKKIMVNEGQRVISRNDYYAYGSEQTVQLFNYSPDDYSETPSPSVMIAPVPDDLELSGTVTENTEYRTTTITSSQVIESGKTTYMAEEGIYLAPGFEVREGAGFEAIVHGDSVHLVTMLTYNTHGKHTYYVKHAEVIRNSKADVAAIQEMRGVNKLEILREHTGLSGDRCYTIKIAHYGIGLFWNPDKVGNPLAKSYKTVKTNDKWYEKKRAYMVAEFNDFCFVSTHYSSKPEGREKMSRKILGDSLVQSCVAADKPVYIAGDLNESPDGSRDNQNQEAKGPAIKILTDYGFEVLNDTAFASNSTHATRPTGAHIDLILEHNVKPNHKTIDRGIPIPQEERDKWLKEDKISDHFPYSVKVKIR